MDKNRAAHQARLLIAAHGLDPNLFQWNRGKNMMGLMSATYNRITDEVVLKSISLSSYWVEAMTEDEVREVILHEIAHALCPRDQHNWKFRAKVREIGGTAQGHCFGPSAETKARMDAIAPHAWVGTCRNGHVTKMHRAPTVVRSCGKCSRSWRFENVPVWKKNGKTVPMEQMPTKYRVAYHKLAQRNLVAALMR